MQSWLERIGATPQANTDSGGYDWGNWDQSAGGPVPFEVLSQQAAAGDYTPELQNQLNNTGSSTGVDNNNFIQNLYNNSQVDYSKQFDPNAGAINGIPTLGSDAFTWNDATGGWNPNMANSYLNSLMNTAGYGVTKSGLGALSNTNYGSYMTDLGNDDITPATKRAIAQQLGIDLGSADWESQLDDAAKNYVWVGGMSGRNPDDARWGDYTLYQRQEDGGWNPIQNQGTSIQEKGSYLEEHPAALFPLLVLGAGLAAGGIGAAAAGGAGGSGAATGATAAGTAAGGAGSTAATAGGLGQTLANAVGLGSQYAGLPGFVQSGLMGSLQGGLTSGLTGGDIGKGFLMGGLTGGLGGAVSPYVNQAVGSLGMGNTANAALSSAIKGGLSSAIQGNNPLTGALMGGLGGGTGSLANSAGFGNLGSSLASGLATTGAKQFLNQQIQDEVLQGRTDIINNLYQEATSRGISSQQLNAFLSTPQGRQAAQALLSQQGKGTLQSLFG